MAFELEWMFCERPESALAQAKECVAWTCMGLGWQEAATCSTWKRPEASVRPQVASASEGRRILAFCFAAYIRAEGTSGRFRGGVAFGMDIAVGIIAGSLG